MSDGRGDLDGQEASDANEESEHALGSGQQSQRSGGLTVTKTPHPNVHSSVVELKRLRMAGISPAIGMRGTMATMDRRLEYHARATAELSTTSSEALMTREWMAVVHEERTPKMTPRLHTHMSEDLIWGEGEPHVLILTLLEFHRTPTKNPSVTTAQHARAFGDGGSCPTANARPTVMGNKRPRAIW